MTLTSCARDRDVDDHNREEYQKRVKEMKAVEGLYGGTLTRESTGQDLGPVSLSLNADGRVSDDISTQKAVLKANFVYRGNNVVSLVFGNSSFDPDTKEFTSTISRNDTDLDLEGAVANDILTGRISIFGFENEAAVFTLTKIKAGFKTAESVVANSPKPNESFEDLKLNYSGVAVAQGHSPEPLVATVENSFWSIEERFFDFMSSKKRLAVNLKWGLTETTFPQAIWDRTNRQLTGSTVQTGGISTSINCSSLVDDPEAFTCNYRSSERSVAVTLTLRPSVQ
jgi:hypothetical protein